MMSGIGVMAVTAALTAAALSPSAPTSERTVLLYHTNETSGTIAHDASGSHNVGRLVNVTLGAEGYNGSKAYRFGVRPDFPSYVVTPSSASLNPGTQPISYTVRWRIGPSTPIPHDMRLIKRGSSQTAGADVKMELKVDKARGVVLMQCGFRDQNNKSADLYRRGVWNDGYWHTTTCTKKDHRIQMTNDGTVSTKLATLGNLSSDSPLYLGIERNPHRWAEQFVGRIDDVVVTKGQAP
jgi:laminin G domain protein